jgi:acyl-CoA thioester hydrolase
VFIWQARVYWEDTDAGGVVYYANYLRFLERARTEWLRARGFDQSRLQAESQLVFAVTRVEAEFRSPARLDDVLHVSCEPSLQRARIHFRQRVWRDRPEGDLLVEAAVQVACLDAERFAPRRLPDELRAGLGVS